MFCLGITIHINDTLIKFYKNAFYYNILLYIRIPHNSTLQK